MDPSLKFSMMSELNDSIHGLVQIKDGHVQVIDPTAVRGFLTDRLVYNAVFQEDPLIKATSRWMLKEIAQSLQLFPCSTQGIYEAASKRQKPNFIMPAIRIPGLSYDVACAVFRAAKGLRSGAFVFEISPFEIKETRQTAAEFSAVIMAAGVREEYQGPVFLQAGPFQIDPDLQAQKDPEYEIQELKILIKEAIGLGYFNLRICGPNKHLPSNLTVMDAQRNLIERISMLTSHIRGLQPNGTTIMVDGEIGVNPDIDPADFLEKILEQYHAHFQKKSAPLNGLSKVSIKIARGDESSNPTMKSLNHINLEVIHQAIRKVKVKYGIACSFNAENFSTHGENLDLILGLGAEEIHLSTEFRESYFSLGEIPSEFRQQISTSTIPLLDSRLGPHQNKEGQVHLISNKSFGTFKEKIWELPFSARSGIGLELENSFSTLFEKLKISNTYDWVRKITPEHRIPFSLSHELDACKR